MYYDELASEVDKGGFFDRDEQYQQTLVEHICDNFQRLRDRGSWLLVCEYGHKLIRNLGRPALTDICEKLGICLTCNNYDVSTLRDKIVNFYGVGTKTITGYIVGGE